jgi:hypothetical protein
MEFMSSEVLLGQHLDTKSFFAVARYQRKRWKHLLLLHGHINLHFWWLQSNSLDKVKVLIPKHIKTSTKLSTAKGLLQCINTSTKLAQQKRTKYLITLPASLQGKGRASQSCNCSSQKSHSTASSSSCGM